MQKHPRYPPACQQRRGSHEQRDRLLGKETRATWRRGTALAAFQSPRASYEPSAAGRRLRSDRCNQPVADGAPAPGIKKARWIRSDMTRASCRHRRVRRAARRGGEQAARRGRKSLRGLENVGPEFVGRDTRRFCDTQSYFSRNLAAARQNVGNGLLRAACTTRQFSLRACYMYGFSDGADGLTVLHNRFYTAFAVKCKPCMAR